MTRVHRELDKMLIAKQRALIGAAEKDDKHTDILNRLLPLKSHGRRFVPQYEPDPRHAEILVNMMGLDGARPKNVNTPGAEGDLCEDETPQEHNLYVRCRS